MKRLDGQELFDIVGRVDADLVDDALPPSMAATVGRAPARRLHPIRAFTRFAATGVGAAVISGVVAVGVLVAIVAAGQAGGPGIGPAGTAGEDRTTSFLENTTDTPDTESETEPSIEPIPMEAIVSIRESSLDADRDTYTLTLTQAYKQLVDEEASLNPHDFASMHGDVPVVSLAPGKYDFNIQSEREDLEWTYAIAFFPDSVYHAKPTAFNRWLSKTIERISAERLPYDIIIVARFSSGESLNEDTQSIVSAYEDYEFIFRLRIADESSASDLPTHRFNTSLKLSCDSLSYHAQVSVLGDTLGAFTATEAHRQAVAQQLTNMAPLHLPGILYSENALLLIDPEIAADRILQVTVTDPSYAPVAIYTDESIGIEATESGTYVRCLSELPDGVYYVFIRLAFAGDNTGEAVGYDFPFVLVKRPSVCTMPLTITTANETVTATNAHTKLTNEVSDLLIGSIQAKLPESTLRLDGLPTVTAVPFQLIGSEASSLTLFHIAVYDTGTGAPCIDMSSDQFETAGASLFDGLSGGEYIVVVRMIDESIPDALRTDSTGYAVGDYEYALRLMLPN